MQQHRNKTSYHPYILIAFYLNCLPEDILQIIPRSTRFDWHYRNIENTFGHAWYQENKNLFDTLQIVSQNKKLLKINKALVRVMAIKAFIKKNAAGINAGFASLKKVAASNIQKVCHVIGLAKALKYLDIDFKYYAKLNRKIACPASIFDLCLIKHPSQLLTKEIGIIKSYCTDVRCLHWPLASLYHQIKKDGAAFFCISTFYKYAKLLKLGRTKPPNRRKNHLIGLRATKPLEILHADATLFTMKDNARAYIYLLQDNFSRAILSFRAALECKAQYAFENLKDVHERLIARSGIEHCSLVTDDGSENHGEAASFVNASVSPEIVHLIAQKTIMQSNSMIEAANKQIKYHFLYHKEIANFEQLKKYLQQAVEDYNNRPHNVLNGLTPTEVLNGKKPSEVDFKKQLSVAKGERLIANKKMKCCSYSF